MVPDLHQPLSVLRSTPRLLLALAVLLALTEPAVARLRVSHRGPRSATAAARFRRALAAAGVHSGTLSVYLRRGRPRWVVRARFTPPGGQPVAMGLRTRAGRVSPAQAAAFARRARAAVRGAAPAPAPAPQPAKPKPPPQPQPAKPQPQPQPPAAEPEPPPPAQPEPSPQPTQPQPQATDDTLGFQVNEPEPPPSATTRPTVAEYKKSAGPTVKKRRAVPRDRLVARLGAGLGLAWRRFLLDAQTSAMSYESGLFSQLSVDGELYPLQLMTRSAIARLGLRLSYARSAGLSTEIAEEKASLSTAISRIWAGLVYRLPRFRNPRLPRFDVRAGFTHVGFDIDEDPDVRLNVQDLSLTAFAAGATVVIYFKRYLGVELGGEYRVMLGVRSDFMTPYHTSPGSLHGFHAVGGLRGRVIGGLGYRGSVSAERFFGNLPSLTTEAELMIRDWTVGADLALTYEM